LIRALPKMERLLRNHAGPFVASVGRSGDVKIVRE